MGFDGIRSIEWYAHNEVRAYPLTVTANGVSVDQTFTLPNAAILAIYIHLPWSRDIDPSRFFISQFANVSGFVELTISYSPPSGSPSIVAIARTPSQVSDSPSVRELLPTADWADVAGSVTFGTRSSLGNLPVGVFTFNLANTQLEVDCVRPSARNLSGILVQNADEVFELATGVVNLRAGQNVRLRVQEVSTDVRDIWIDAVDRQFLNTDCECGDVLTNPIRTINGIRPNSSGNFDVTGAKCLDINTSTGLMTMDNPCSTPCCGCEEAEALQEAINRFAPQLNTLANFAPRLSAQMDRLEFFAQSADLGKSCDTEAGGGGSLPPGSVTTTTSTTTTSGLQGPQIAAIEIMLSGNTNIAGLANNAEDGTTFDIDWQFVIADALAAALPFATCRLESCGSFTFSPITAATLPAVTRPDAGKYDLLVNMSPDGADVPCDSSLWTPGGPVRHMRIIGRVYVPAPVYVDIRSESTASTVDGDRLTWGFRHLEIIDGPASYDLTTLPIDTNFDVVSTQQRVRSTNDWCVGGAWNQYATFTSAVLRIHPYGYLLLKGWHDVVFDIRRSSKPRGDGQSNTFPIEINVKSACRLGSFSSRQYRLVLLNYTSTQQLTFSLAANVGAVSPAQVNSHSLRSGGIVVEVDPDATSLTATAGSLVITVPLPSVPARAGWNTATTVGQSPTDNYVIELNSLPACS